MTIPSVHFEARKVAYRQTKEGVVISFVVHPNEVDASFAISDIGTRYMVVLARIGDDEQPIEPNPSASADGPSAREGGHAGSKQPLVTGRAEGAKRERTLPEKVGMRCNDERFQEWAKKRHISGAALDTASFVRNYCGVTSRKEILPGTEAGDTWLSLETRYLMETGQMAEPR